MCMCAFQTTSYLIPVTSVKVCVIVVTAVPAPFTKLCKGAFTRWTGTKQLLAAPFLRWFLFVQQQQQQQQQCGTVCRLQSGGQTERWIDRESVLCARLTAGCAPQMLHHAWTQLFIIYMTPLDMRVLCEAGRGIYAAWIHLNVIQETAYIISKSFYK